MKLKATIEIINICQESFRDDKPIWDLSNSRKFTIGSAYSLIQNSIPSNYIQDINKSFDWIWKLICLNKFKTLIWLIHHGRLQTAKYLHRIGIGVNQHCNICAHSEEDINHIFIECINATVFWDTVSSNSMSNDSDISSILSLKNRDQLWKITREKPYNTLLPWDVMLPFCY